MRQLDGIAVTNGPGLAGSLLVGVNTAKGLAMSQNLPFIGINHLEGHVYASWLEDGVDPESNPGFPLMCLITSGGHTDSGPDGGPWLLPADRQDARRCGRRGVRQGCQGSRSRVSRRTRDPASRGRCCVGSEPDLPRPRVKNSLDFSFSGLKTAVLRRAEQKGMYPAPDDMELDDSEVSEVAFAFQEAIVDSMVRRTLEAVKRHRVQGIILGGGVAANAHLRSEMAKRSPVEVIVPRPGLCTDNGAMIGAAAHFAMSESDRRQWDLDVVPSLRLG